MPHNSPAEAKGNEIACNVAVDMAGRPAVCFGRGYAHNSPNECINRAGYLSLQVAFLNDTSCFNVSGPSLATNATPATVFVSPQPQDQ